MNPSSLNDILNDIFLGEKHHVKTKLLNHNDSLNAKIKTLKGSEILLVEDNDINQEIIVELLRDSGINIDLAIDGFEAIKKTENKKYELILMDIQMPILDSKGDIEEVISVRHDITDIYNLQKEIEDTQKEVVFTMGAIGETRSKETGNHVKRVAEYSRILAQYVGLSKEDITLLADASPMHDIGKVGIPDNILHKPGRLTDDEFIIMRTHAELGYKMLAYSNRSLLKTAAKVALEHHERWDGFGYPKHLKEEEISIEGRITAIADVFDALGSDRVYKEAWSDERIFEYFREERGKQFDPKLIDLFFEYLDNFLEIRNKFKDID